MAPGLNALASPESDAWRSDLIGFERCFWALHPHTAPLWETGR